MPQRVNLRNSYTLYSIIKAFYVCAGFLHFAVFARLVVLLPLVGRKFLPGGIQSFFEHSVYALSAVELVFSALKLLPIGPLKYLLGNSLKVVVVHALSWDLKLQRHPAYSLYIGELALMGMISYAYHYQKLQYLGNTPAWSRGLFQYASVIEFPLRSVLEFVILFMSLKFLHGKEKQLAQLILLLMVPTKGLLYKRQLAKFFQMDSFKTD